MDSDLRRRLDVLIFLCSGLLGIVLTYLFFSDRTGPMFLLFAFVPTAIIVAMAIWYSDSGSHQ